MEGNCKSSLKRWRTIFANGDWLQSYLDKDVLDYGYALTYSATGDVWRGERYKSKWYGLREETYADGRWEIGEVFNNEKFGDWRVIERDGTERIDKYY